MFLFIYSLFILYFMSKVDDQCFKANLTIVDGRRQLTLLKKLKIL